jgi:uncharacterized protein with beta-barrel porin domain/membrane-associated phospholipid phosphatase
MAATAIAAALASPAYAATANVSPATVNVINLLSPFLTLDSTTVGQETLQADLSQAVAINQNAASVALLNNYYSTAGLGALAISDENSLGTASTTLYGTTIAVGPAANLAGALPTQNTTAYGTLYNGSQQYGAFGSVLGPAYVAAVNPSSPTLPNTILLLTTAFNFTGNSLSTGDSQVAKFYFANGTWNGTTAAVAPVGYTLPTYSGLPNTTNSVYDEAYGVTNAETGQNQYGDSHPYQTYTDIPGATYTLYDPTVKTATATKGAVNPDKPSSNPAFPSSHMAYAMTDAILLGILAPQTYQSLLVRASEIGESRIVVGVHYPTDIIASRAFVSYDLAQYLSNPAYINNAAVTGTAVNLPSLVTAAEGEIQTVLGSAAVSAGCGTSFATCATSSANVNPYAPSAENAAVYAARLTYGLPTLSFAQAPQEAAPAGGPDASILLATVYGGSTSAAQTLAPNGGMDGSLQTSTINQIIENTETNALAAFYGTSLSYWSRLNLYGAIGYFSGVTGSLALQSSDVVDEPVTVASGGVLGGTGTIVGATTVQSGGVLAPGGFNASNQPATPGTLTINGALTLNAGSTYTVQVGSTASLANVSGVATLGGAAVTANFVPGSSFAKQYTIVSAGSVVGTFGTLTNVGLPANLVDTLSYNDPTQAYLNLSLNFSQSGALNGNEANVGAALSDYFSSTGAIPTTYAALGPNGLAQASGELATAPQRATFSAMNSFIGAFFDGVGVGDDGLIGQRANPNGPLFYDDPTPPTHKSAALAAISPQNAFTPSWSVWAQSYGGSETIGGDGATGANSATDQVYGMMVGADYRAAPDTVLGFGFGGAGTNFGLANAMGSGRSDLGQAGVYGVRNFGSAYIAAAAAFGFQSVTTNRTVTAAPGNSLQAKFNAETLAARAEAGERFVTPYGAVTPYAALQLTGLFLPSYGETSSTGSPLFALNYASQTVTDTRFEVGGRINKAFALPDSVLTLSGRLAWAHDFDSNVSATATFQSLPGASFVVDGASPAANSALVSAGAAINWANGVSFDVAFDGEFSANVQSYAGHGTLRRTF